MDPETIAGFVEGSLSLAVRCGSGIKTFCGQYKYGKLDYPIMIQNLDVMRLAWDRIGTWLKEYRPTNDDGLTQRLARSLKTVSLVLDALEEDLKTYTVFNMTFALRLPLGFFENIFQGHETHIRDQAYATGLLLQAIQL